MTAKLQTTTWCKTLMNKPYIICLAPDNQELLPFCHSTIYNDIRASTRAGVCGSEH